MAIALIIMGALYTILISQRKALSEEEHKIRRDQKIRVVLDDMVRTLRNSGSNPTGTLLPGNTVGIIAGDSSSLSLLTDLNGDGDTGDGHESAFFTYDLPGQRVLKNGSELGGQITAMTFSYYDSQGNTLALPLSAGDRVKVRKIAFSLTARTAVEFKRVVNGFNLLGTAADGTAPLTTLTVEVVPVNFGVF